MSPLPRLVSHGGWGMCSYSSSFALSVCHYTVVQAQRRASGAPRQFPYRDEYAHRYLFRPKNVNVPDGCVTDTVCVLCMFLGRRGTRIKKYKHHSPSNFRRHHATDPEEKPLWEGFDKWIVGKSDRFRRFPVQDAGTQALLAYLTQEPGGLYVRRLSSEESGIYNVDILIADFIRKRYVPHLSNAAFESTFVPCYDASLQITR
eukprot:GHVU01160200.1.p2 GENE.GHVU01160200.1~~GHVU01160200.1.p2  ORF type:complete len:203 (-),score=3.90 GHVU01160200.1:357-965(-)